MKRPEIKDYIGLKDATIEELRKQKEQEMKLKYPNRLVFVDKEMNVFVSK